MLFTVIIPVYNAEAWITEALQSLVEQSFTDFDVILVNDGSTDNSAKIIERFIGDNPKVKWHVINQENRGLGAARNVAAKQAKGKWLAFLDADDYWSGHKLLQCQDFIAKHAVLKWFYHEVYELYPNGRLRERVAFSFKNLGEWLQNGNPIVPSATVIRKDVFIAQSGFDEERDSVEDLGLWLRLLSNNVFPGFLEETLTVYRMGSGLTQNADDHHKKVMAAMNAALEKGWVSTEQLKQFENRKAYEFARQFHKNKAFKKAIEGYKKCPTGLKVSLLKMLAHLQISV